MAARQYSLQSIELPRPKLLQSVMNQATQPRTLKEVYERLVDIEQKLDTARGNLIKARNMCFQCETEIKSFLEKQAKLEEYLQQLLTQKSSSKRKREEDEPQCSSEPATKKSQ